MKTKLLGFYSKLYCSSALYGKTTLYDALLRNYVSLRESDRLTNYHYIFYLLLAYYNAGAHTVHMRSTKVRTLIQLTEPLKYGFLYHVKQDVAPW